MPETENEGLWGVKIDNTGKKFRSVEGLRQFVKDAKIKNSTAASPTPCKCNCRRSSANDADQLKKAILINDEDDDDADDQLKNVILIKDEDDDDEIGIQPRGWRKSFKPRFVNVLKRTHFYSMPLRKKFVWESGIARKGKIMLRSEAGREWSIGIHEGARRIVFMKKGWSKFWEDNKLKVGDTCSFQYHPGKGSSSSFIKFEVIREKEREGLHLTNQSS